MTEALAALDDGSWTKGRGIRLGEWLDNWLVDIGERKLAAKTMAGYRTHSLNF